ncbi:hypothetical protein DK853_46620, partial [Klebsiella oxytoca]
HAVGFIVIGLGNEINRILQKSSQEKFPAKIFPEKIPCYTETSMMPPSAACPSTPATWAADLLSTWTGMFTPDSS